MDPASLYIHIPFCKRKCLFCSFAITVGQEHRREEYVDVLISQMKGFKGGFLKTIYFGGGTPSMLETVQLKYLLDAIRENFSLSNDTEITIEANPESIDLERSKGLVAMGFNRVSLGVQSLNDRYLKFLGRTHDAKHAKDAFHILRDAGFANISLDLMYGFPGQTVQELEEDVQGVAALKSEHLSLYTLTIEPNSRFHAVQMKLDDDEKLAKQYLLIARLLGDHGFKQYEVSNFSKEGFRSRHNTNYWMGGTYIGLGTGAHGFDGHRRYWNTSNFQEYMQKTAGDKPGTGLISFEDLNESQIIIEKVLFGLRMNDGIDWGIVPLSKHEQINAMVKDGFLSLEKGRLKTTDQGRLVLDELSSRLI